MTAQEHGFKAEVQQLLQLMIRSVYSDRDVFLRELVSNAADALDKVRFMQVTRDDLVEGKGEIGIHVTIDAEARTLTIDDDGVGMTEDEVIQNLGTIAHSGSKAFLQQLQEAKNEEVPDLIGQFGVGFYSAFMVAEEVRVETRSALPDAEAVVWTSSGEGTYTVEAGERESRGTRIVLHLREDADEYLEASKLSSIIQKHSNYLTWTITVDGEQANSGKALWMSRPGQITDDEANSFYNTIASDWRDPAAHIHVAVDSPIQYHALLFIPMERPYDLFLPEADRGPRLYAKRVLIEEHARELLPDWLRFVKGVVDSEDISLNVSREMVQKTAVVRKIRSALTKKVLKELARMAKRAKEPVEVAEGEDVDEGPNPKEIWDTVWRAFGVPLKEGYYHDDARYGDKLVELFHFNTVSHEDETGLMSLAEYKEAMPEDQDTIWYLAGESRASCLQSPHLEAFQKKGWDVLLFTDTVDEWLVSKLTEYDGVEIKSIARGELELDDEEAGESVDLSGLTPWMKGILDDRVKEIRASSRLTDSACVLVDDDAGMSSNLERILRSANQDVAGSKRILELNARHPLIKSLVQLHEDGKTDAAQPLVELLYDDALLLEGTVKEPAAMGRRLQDLLERAAQAALG